jgi:hypothetical protein
MPLNLEPRTGGDFVPYIKFNGKAGRWYTRNDVGDEVEVTDFRAAFDLGQIKTGWLYFAEGQPPQTIWDTNGRAADKPFDMPQAKRGFSVNVFAPKLGGLRELSGTSNGLCMAIRELYDGQFEKAPERFEGKVPVVRCERVVPVKSKFGTNYEPVLKIEKWIDRPVGLPQQHAPVPPKPAPATSGDFVDDFGSSSPKPKLNEELDDEIPFDL